MAKSLSVLEYQESKEKEGEGRDDERRILSFPVSRLFGCQMPGQHLRPPYPTPCALCPKVWTGQPVIFFHSFLQEFPKSSPSGVQAPPDGRTSYKVCRSHIRSERHEVASEPDTSLLLWENFHPSFHARFARVQIRRPRT